MKFIENHFNKFTFAPVHSSYSRTIYRGRIEHTTHFHNCLQRKDRAHNTFSQLSTEEGSSTQHIVTTVYRGSIKHTTHFHNCLQRKVQAHNTFSQLSTEEGSSTQHIFTTVYGGRFRHTTHFHNCLQRKDQAHNSFSQLSTEEGSSTQHIFTTVYRGRIKYTTHFHNCPRSNGFIEGQIETVPWSRPWTFLRTPRNQQQHQQIYILLLSGIVYLPSIYSLVHYLE